jgi:hypothetical protein
MWIWLKVDSFDRSLLNRELWRFIEKSSRPNSERAFESLIGNLERNWDGGHKNSMRSWTTKMFYHYAISNFKWNLMTFCCALLWKLNPSAVTKCAKALGK